MFKMIEKTGVIGDLDLPEKAEHSTERMLKYYNNLGWISFLMLSITWTRVSRI